jgi:hypothetical protein
VRRETNGLGLSKAEEEAEEEAKRLEESRWGVHTLFLLVFLGGEGD